MVRTLGMAAALLLWAASAGAQAPAARPNVVFIITDDVGYGDIGSYGAPDIRTPNIDSLARDGVRLTDFYANAPLCSPTRAGLVTGRYQQRFAIEAALGSPPGAAEQGLPTTGRSLPQLLKVGGYATALIGKWHLGYKPEFSPNAHGYDYFFGFKSGYIDYYQHTGGNGQPDLFENAEPVTVDGYMTDLITQRSTRFIEQNAARPFFLEVAYNAGHWPYQVPDRPSTAVRNAAHLMPHDENTSTRADYVAMMERADQGVGEILRTLDRLGLAANTLVIFTNDNGGEWLSRNAPLFNRKWTLWEGGIRVPAIVRWPGRIPAGRVSPQVGVTMDFTASILAVTGTAVPADAKLEGINILPILAGEQPVVERTLFWRTNAGGHQQRAVRSGDMKLMIDGNHTMLFDVRADLGEREDVAAQRQDLARRLRTQLTAWEADVDAEAMANGSVTFNSGRGRGAGPARGGGPGRGRGGTQ
jgi:arylsulfatase A-like enzyme